VTRGNNFFIVTGGKILPLYYCSKNDNLLEDQKTAAEKSRRGRGRNNFLVICDNHRKIRKLPVKNSVKKNKTPS